MIPYGRHLLDSADERAVLRALRSGRITQGPLIERFEKAFAGYCGARYAIAVSSGTAGLHLACLAAGFGPKDRVVTSPLTFVATPNSVLYTGATPVFVDIDETLGVEEGAFKRACESARGAIPVHFAGEPCVPGLHTRRKNFTMIEDACHALGAEYSDGYKWHRVGACSHADMSVFSFHPVKHITTGEGGMITTNHREFYEQLVRLRSHGIERDGRHFISKKKSDGSWYYEMQMLGFNYRITDIQCALGLSQLKKLGAFVRIRREIAAEYTRALRWLPALKTPRETSWTRSSYHLYILRVNFKRLRTTRVEFMRRLAQKGVGSQVHYIPVYRQPFYQQRFKHKPSHFPATEAYYREALSIPIFPSMKAAEVRRTTRAIKELCACP